MTERILCVIAHPDDETLMCGGTLAKHILAGDTVMVYVLCSSRGSRQVPGTDVECRRQFLAALKVLGIVQNAFSAFPDQQFDTIPLLVIVREVEDCLRVFQPSIVYTHWRGDLNLDHRITSEAVCVACRPFPGQTVKGLLFGECASSTEWNPGGAFAPNWFVDISETSELKRKALLAYASELREYPHPRSIEGATFLAFARGMPVGIGGAEAFMLGRGVA